MVKTPAEMAHSLRTGRGLTEVPNEDGATLRDAWVHQIMKDAADMIDRLAPLAAERQAQLDHKTRMRLTPDLSDPNEWGGGV